MTSTSRARGAALSRPRAPRQWVRGVFVAEDRHTCQIEYAGSEMVPEKCVIGMEASISEMQQSRKPDMENSPCPRSATRSCKHRPDLKQFWVGSLEPFHQNREAAILDCSDLHAF